MRDTPDEPHLVDGSLPQPLRRVLGAAGGRRVIEALVELPGADFTTLALEIMRRRARRLSAAELLRRYEHDRFAAPGPVPYVRLRRAEDALLGALPPGFEVVQLAPVAPLGAHSVIADVDQNRVVSTVRGSEVAADATNGLALEAARRRQARAGRRRAAPLLRLAALQRVLRAQRFDGPISWAHFTMLGLATAGRDLGALAFERVAAGEHCMLAGRRVARRGCVAGPDRGVGPRRGGCASVCDHVRRALDGRPNVTVVDRPERTEGRAYYRGFCFKGFASFGGPWVEAADGGAVDWTARLLADRKERLFISGLGVDRIALGGRDAL